MINFNSIKVRLKLDINPQVNQNLIFQFHKGTIKTLLMLFLSLRINNFNSIKVRLKLACVSS